MTTKNQETSLFLQKNSAAIRIWHWLAFLVITTLIITVLMASTALNPRSNVPAIQNILAEKGVTVDAKQAFSVAHMYDDKMWEFHKYMGFMLALLVISRIVIEFTQNPGERNQTRIKNALYAFLQSKEGPGKKELKHYLLIKYVYLLFYMLIIMMVITGIIIAFGGDLGLTGQARHLVKEIHGFIQYFIYAFIIFHLGGVIISDLGKYKGIVSGMINGGK